MHNTSKKFQGGDGWGAQAPKSKYTDYATVSKINLLFEIIKIIGNSLFFISSL